MSTLDHRYFRSAPARAIRDRMLHHTMPRHGDLILELGCGGSRWLPLLAQQARVTVRGVDFSETGVRWARELLASSGGDGSGIVLDTIDEYSRKHAGEADIVVSFGLIEHFSRLDDIVEAHIRCARPGGRIFMSAPNLSSLNLRWARLVSPDIFTWHCPISAKAVVESCHRCGGEDIVAEFLGGPRLFSTPTDAFGSSKVVRQLVIVGARSVNGVGEIVNRVAPTLASRISGQLLSPYFSVACSRSHL